MNGADKIVQAIGELRVQQATLVERVDNALKDHRVFSKDISELKTTTQAHTTLFDTAKARGLGWMDIGKMSAVIIGILVALKRLGMI